MPPCDCLWDATAVLPELQERTVPHLSDFLRTGSDVRFGSKADIITLNFGYRPPAPETILPRASDMPWGPQSADVDRKQPDSNFAAGIAIWGRLPGEGLLIQCRCHGQVLTAERSAVIPSIAGARTNRFKASSRRPELSGFPFLL